MKLYLYLAHSIITTVIFLMEIDMYYISFNQEKVKRVTGSYIERIGATRSREAIRIPSSAMAAVRSKAQVGSPLALL